MNHSHFFCQESGFDAGFLEKRRVFGGATGRPQESNNANVFSGPKEKIATTAENKDAGTDQYDKSLERNIASAKDTTEVQKILTEKMEAVKEKSADERAKAIDKVRDTLGTLDSSFLAVGKDKIGTYNGAHVFTDTVLNNITNKYNSLESSLLNSLKKEAEAKSATETLAVSKFSKPKAEETLKMKEIIIAGDKKINVNGVVKNIPNGAPALHDSENDFYFTQYENKIYYRSTDGADLTYIELTAGSNEWITIDAQKKLISTNVLEEQKTSSTNASDYSGSEHFEGSTGEKTADQIAATEEKYGITPEQKAKNIAFLKDEKIATLAGKTVINQEQEKDGKVVMDLVKEWQKGMNAKANEQKINLGGAGKFGNVGVDGNVGPETEKAIAVLQDENGIKASKYKQDDANIGKLEDTTFDISNRNLQVFHDNAEQFLEFLAKEEDLSETLKTLLLKGKAEAADPKKLGYFAWVEELQNEINQKCPVSELGEPCTADGYFGKKTRAAVEVYLDKLAKSAEKK